MKQIRIKHQLMISLALTILAPVLLPMSLMVKSEIAAEVIAISTNTNNEVEVDCEALYGIGCGG